MADEEVVAPSLFGAPPVEGAAVVEADPPTASTPSASAVCAVGVIIALSATGRKEARAAVAIPTRARAAVVAAVATTDATHPHAFGPTPGLPLTTQRRGGVGGASPFTASGRAPATFAPPPCGGGSARTEPRAHHAGRAVARTVLAATILLVA